ncbi:hypothetical protein GCM10027598_20540 [Amycolatopsis oliviviridis]|uniref:Uncharacterized protein n=1 Tax=Amycolatopsis oliviviridis TaxID=1471590 RepID=A0ABQ3LFP6_9PSEU|nr:hypothetical protein GCM10017790_28190 [Amycolatopsis oliviviridis]
MTRVAPESPATPAARSTAANEESDPSVPTTTVRYAAIRNLHRSDSPHLRASSDDNRSRTAPQAVVSSVG